MANTNEVATSFEVVKHQGYWFILKNNHTECSIFVFEHKSDAISAERKISYFLSKADWQPFNPRTHFEFRKITNRLYSIKGFKR